MIHFKAKRDIPWTGLRYRIQWSGSANESRKPSGNTWYLNAINLLYSKLEQNALGWKFCTNSFHIPMYTHYTTHILFKIQSDRICIKIGKCLQLVRSQGPTCCAFNKWRLVCLFKLLLKSVCQTLWSPTHPMIVTVSPNVAITYQWLNGHRKFCKLTVCWWSVWGQHKLSKICILYMRLWRTAQSWVSLGLESAHSSYHTQYSSKWVRLPGIPSASHTAA